MESSSMGCKLGKLAVSASVSTAIDGCVRGCVATLHVFGVLVFKVGLIVFCFACIQAFLFISRRGLALSLT